MSFIGSTEPPNQLDNEISVVDLVASHDWSSTPLGPMETWDSTLKSTVNLCLHSVFPIAIYYGPEFVSIYNQMWRPILKMKHPQALGKPFKEVWPETHHTTEPIFNEVMATRKGRFENDMLFVTDRDGYVEETYASFTLSPIFKEDGSMGGILNASQETTQRVLANRRLKALTELGNKTPGAKSVKDACHLITQTIRNNNADMPYALIYLIENHSATSNTPSTDTPKAHLVATTFDEDLDLQKVDGFDEISVAEDKLRRFLPDFLLDTEEIVDLANVSDEIDELIKSDGNLIKSTVCIKPGKSNALSSGLDNDPKFCTLFETGEKIITSPDFSSSWPLQYVARTNLHITVTLKDYTHAVLFPVKNTTGDLTAIIIIGINKQRALDKEYMEFLHLVIGQVSTSLSHGRFSEEERKQAEMLASLNDQKILFFQNISHELRTPLTLMLSPLEEVLEECPRDVPMYSHLCMIQRNTRRLLRLVNTLLQFSRIESDKIEANYHEVDIGQLTSELAANFESMAKLFKLEYRVEIPDNFDSRLEKKVFVDLEMYEKIIFNLCSNAFKHTWNGGITVRLDADRKDNKEVVVLEVTDTGVGISEEEIPNLFQRFYRIKSRQSRCHEGTGIGLALVKELTSLHGGDITCTSVLDRGTTFKICLPTGHEHLVSKRIFFRDDLNKGKGLLTLDRNNILFDNKQLYLDESLQWIQNNDREFEENENEKEQDTENDMNIDSDNGKIGDNCNDEYKELILESKEKYFPHTIEDPIPLINSKHVVLLVDDNADMRNYLIGLLQKEYTVYSAFDGRDALRLLKRLKCPPDLILSDILMPNMNGYELLKNIRNNNATQSIPVILLSAKAEEGDSIIGLDKGASDYLTKPFSARELMARVRVNIKLSYLRQQLFLHQYHQAETKQLLFSISNKIHSGYNLKETLSSAVEEIHNILPSDRLFVVANEQYEGGNDVIVAFSAKDKNEKNLEGNTVKYTSEQIKKQSDPALFGRGDIGKKGMLCSSCGGSKLDDHFLIANKTLSEIENENKFIEPGSQISAIENMVQHSDHKDLEIAIIPKFYSFIVQKHVSLLAVAIIVNNSIWGWIKAHRLPNHNWLDWEKEFLQQISNQISLAITHSKLSEEKLKKDAQMEAAKAANEAKGQILANTSHELRTPLGAIIGVLSALEETPLTEDQKDMIDIMSRASDVVLSVVNDILDAAKMEAQKIKLMNRAFNLFDLVEKTIELFGERAGTKQIELILDCEPNKLPKFVISDPERLQQVLVNLLSNSIKFTDNGQIVFKISISSYDDVIEESSDASAAFEAKGQEIKGKSKLLVEIVDTGIGIEPAFIKVIFDSFSQGDASMTRRHDGTGLGLSICKHLVSINGGELRVQSELGKGSKFWFTWNVDPLEMTATQISSMPQIPQSITSSDEPTNLTFPSMIRSKRVLVIDSVENARHSLVKLISASVDKVDAFDSCEEGINKARQLKSEQNGSPYDLVFLNVYLETADSVKRAALQLRSICGQDLSIAFLVFWSVKGRALGKVLINQIGGHAAALCKPVMQKKLFDCLYNNSLFKQPSDVSDTSEYDMREYNAIRSLVDIRTEKYYFNNRRINDKVPMTIEADENHHRSRGEDLNAMIIDQECVIKDQKVNLIEPQVSNITSTGKEANVVIGVKRNVSEKNDNNPRAQKSRSRAMSKSKCILCVEDNPINLKVIKHQLSKLGYPTLSATNGQEAINLVEAEYAKLPSDHNSSSNPPEPPLRISLILMDCAMPILSGFDASRAIRMMQPPASNIPIIALTASAVQGTRDKCLESGMNDFLTKPLRIPELKEMLNKWF